MHLARLLRKRLKKKTDRTKRKALSKVKLDEKIPFDLSYRHNLISVKVILLIFVLNIFNKKHLNLKFFR